MAPASFLTLAGSELPSAALAFVVAQAGLDASLGTLRGNTMSLNLNTSGAQVVSQDLCGATRLLSPAPVLLGGGVEGRSGTVPVHGTADSKFEDGV
jgi:hypothetical protein